MKRLITYLYNKYCRVQIDTLYIDSLQRDFTKEYTEKEVANLRKACFDFVESGASEYIFNNILRKHSVSFFNEGYIEVERNGIIGDMNVVAGVEGEIKKSAFIQPADPEFDANNPL